MGLALAEVTVRVAFPHVKDHVMPPNTFALDGALGWRLNADHRGVHRSRGFEAEYETNARGFRDRPRPLEKQPNSYRVLLYGDSQVFGWGVGEEERFSNLLERELPSLAVWNLGVPGYGLDQGLLSYEQDGGTLAADEVVFLLSRPMIERSSVGYIFSKHKPRFELASTDSLDLVPVPGESTAAKDLLYAVLSPFYLPYFVDLQLSKLGGSAQAAEPAGEGEPAPPSPLLGELERRLLVRARELTRARTHRFTVLSVLRPPDSEAFREFCGSAGIEFVQVELPPAKEELFLSKHDRHWSPQANRLIADELLPRFRSRVAQ